MLISLQNDAFEMFSENYYNTSALLAATCVDTSRKDYLP